jgi:hypothetical protein
VSWSSDPLAATQAERVGRKRWRAWARDHWGALAVGAVFFLLTLIYNVVTPLWESDNEWAHYQFVRYIATHGGLPTPETEIAIAASDDLCSVLPEGGLTTVHQFRQPPLYYLLAALAVADMDLRVDLPLVENPHVHTPQSQGGLNVVVHGEAERFPYQGTALAVHRIRLLSSIIGLAGLAAVYLGGLLLFPQRRYLAVAIMAVNAFIPQYVFSASVVNNDILAGALGSWVVFWCLLYVLRKPSPAILAIALLTAGAAIITKYTAIILLPVLAATLAISLVRSWQQDRARFWRRLGQTLLVLALASAPVALWLARNWLLYDQLFPAYANVTNRFMQEALVVPNYLQQGRVQDGLYAIRFALMTFWGLFGNDNVALPHAVVMALQGVFLVSLIGAGLVVIDRRVSTVLRVAVLAAAFVLVAAWFVNFIKAAGTAEPRGRYFLPIYSVISFWLVLGIDRLLPARWKVKGAALLPGLLLVLALAVPPFLLRPTYAPPAIVTSAALRPGEQPVNLVFGDFAELLGYRIEPQRIGLYESVEVTLVWRALQETSNNYTVGVHLLDGANVSHNRQTRFPGNGNLATSLWKEGDVFRDTYRVGLGPDARESLPSLGRIKVAMYCHSLEEDRHLEVSDMQGGSVGDAVYLGRLKLAAPDAAQPLSQPALFTFGDEIALEQFSLSPAAFPFGSELVITLPMRALKQPASDYTVFVHLIDAQGATVQTFDLPLTDGYYPSGLWETGEQVTHIHRLPVASTLLAGQYTLRMGLYDPQSGARLPVFDAAGVEQADGAALLRTIDAPDNFAFLPNIWLGQTPEPSP